MKRKILWDPAEILLLGTQSTTIKNHSHARPFVPQKYPRNRKKKSIAQMHNSTRVTIYPTTTTFIQKGISDIVPMAQI